MKIKNKSLAIISSLMLCMVLVSGVFPVKVSAASIKPLSDLAKYYLTGGTQDWDGVEVEKRYKDFLEYKRSNYPERSFYYCIDSSENQYVITYNLDSSISRFKLAFGSILSLGEKTLGEKNLSTGLYYIYTFGVDENSVTLGEKLPRIIIQMAYSYSPMKYELKNSKYCLTSDSEIRILTHAISGSGLTDTYREGRLSSLGANRNCLYSESLLYDYPIDCTNFYENGSYYYFNDYKNHTITWQEIYSNCDMEINGFNFHNEPIKNLKNQIDVKLTPEFGMDMENESFTFSITNNSDTPVQYVMYIIDIDSGGFFEYEYNDSIGDEPDNIHSDIRKYKYENDVYDYRIADCMANFEFELDQCKWLYLTNEYYYLFESELDEIIGFNQDYNLSLSKQYGSSYWHYLGIGQTYSDKIYMKNIALSQNKNYYFRIRSIPIDPSFECSSILFDYDWMYGKSRQLYFEWHMNRSDLISKALQLNEHWWSMSADFHLSDSLKNVYLDSKKVEFLYNQKFSFSKLPSYSLDIPEDSNYNKSSGFSNDKNNVYDPLYKNNLDTGKEEFLKGANADNLADFDISIDNISVDNVKDYISFPKEFINLIKSFFTSFPQLWALLIFGVTAVIVIAIVRYVRG